GRVYERGLKVVTSSYRRVPPQSLSPSIKSLNYLNNIMAKVEANQYGADEALMLDIHGYVSEASAENVFIVRNHTIVTPFTSTNPSCRPARRSEVRAAKARLKERRVIAERARDEVPRAQGEGDLRPIRDPGPPRHRGVEAGGDHGPSPPLHGEGAGPRRRTRQGRRHPARGDVGGR